MAEARREAEREGLTYDDVMQFMRERDWPVTTPLVADHFGISQQAAYYRLNRLHENERVERTKFNQTVLWRPTD